MKRYLAYGVVVESEVNLGHHLYEEDNGSPPLKLLAGRDFPGVVDADKAALAVKSHGRQLQIHSACAWNEETLRLLVVENVATFSWVPGSKTIRFYPGKDAEDELLSFWTVNMVLPVYLALERKYDFIHAGAVEIGDKAVLFAAPSHGGKSTLTAHFIKNGHALISDDKVPVWCEGGVYYTVASHDHYRPYRSHEDLGYKAEEFCRETLPIQGIYVLNRVEPGGDVSINAVSGFRRFGDLMFNYMFNLGELKPGRLDFLAGLVNTVEVNKVYIPHGLERLDEVYAAICDHVKNFVATNGENTA